MKKFISLMCAVISIATLSCPANLIITPEAWGGLGGYENTAGMFDSQPATLPVAGTTTDAFGSTFSIYNDVGRGIYIDFGAGYADYEIASVWLGLKQYGSDGTGSAAPSYWSDTAALSDAQTNGTVAPDFYTSFTSSDTQNAIWYQTWSGSETPAARYYVQVFDGTQDGGNRMSELVFEGVTSAIPEPASALLLGMGALAICLFRRSK